MILFYNDWFKYPTARPDLDTQNKSFLRLAGIYKHMGIKNHSFPLALVNQKLKGVDPFDPDLDDETKILILYESIINPWYYFREVARVPPISGSDPIPFKANRANIATIWCMLNHLTGYLIQPRQTGKTVTEEELVGYGMDLASMNTEFSILTKDDKLRTKTSLRIRSIIEYLPSYMSFLTKKDIKNNEKLTIQAMKNVLNLYVGQKDRKSADNVARGMTTPVIHIDEFAYIYNIDVIIPVMLTAGTAAKEQAAEVGGLYYTLFTTTPGKLNTPEGQFAYKIYKSSLRFNEKFYDFRDEKELHDFVRKNTRKYEVVLLEFNHRQLGYTDEWLVNRIRMSLNEGEDIISNYLNGWTGGTTDSPIPKDIIPIIEKSKKNQYIPYISKYGYIIKLYKDLNYIKNKNNYFVIALDSSDALGGESDDIGLVIRDIKDGSVVGVGKFNETNLIVFSKFILELLQDIPNSVLIPERRSSMSAILDNLFLLMVEDGMNPYRRIFNWIVQEKKYTNNKTLNNEINKKYINLDIITKYKKEFGFATSGSGKTSREGLYGNIFRSALVYTADKIYDTDLIAQLLSLKRINGRIDHEQGEHDDLVIAWLLSMWFILRGSNKDIYGINSRYIFKPDINEEILLKNIGENRDKLREQQKIKDDIERTLEELKRVKSDTKAIQLIRYIKRLERELDKTIIKELDIDSTIREMKFYKRLKRIIAIK